MRFFFWKKIENLNENGNSQWRVWKLVMNMHMHTFMQSTLWYWFSLNFSFEWIHSFSRIYDDARMLSTKYWQHHKISTPHYDNVIVRRIHEPDRCRRDLYFEEDGEIMKKKTKQIYHSGFKGYWHERLWHWVLGGVCICMFVCLCWKKRP